MTSQQPYFKPAFILHTTIAFVALGFLLAIAFGYNPSPLWMSFVFGPMIVLRLLAEYGYRQYIRRHVPPGSNQAEPVGSVSP